MWLSVKRVVCCCASQHPCYVPLHFPLLVPTGQSSWHKDLCYMFTAAWPCGNLKQEFLMYCNFLKHHLHIHPVNIESNHYFWAGFLFQEYIVDSWATSEHSHLEWFWHNQHIIQANLYCSIVDALCEGLDLSSVGCKVILPSSIITGPWFIQKCLQDTLTLLRIHNLQHVWSMWWYRTNQITTSLKTIFLVLPFSSPSSIRHFKDE